MATWGKNKQAALFIEEVIFRSSVYLIATKVAHGNVGQEAEAAMAMH